MKNSCFEEMDNSFFNVTDNVIAMLMDDNQVYPEPALQL